MIDQQQKQAALDISTSLDMVSARQADLIIEAATENPEIKLNLFNQLDLMASANTILASNTSSISLTKIGASTDRPDKVIGMYFFSPVPLMRLLEVVRGLNTFDETSATAFEVGRKMGKEPVEAMDSPGFIYNRILCPIVNEAIFKQMDGIGTPEAINTAMKFGMSHPIGPLTLADLIGLDVVLSAMEVLHCDLSEGKYRPAPLLRKMVDAGNLGHKTGRGFYEYKQ